MKYFIILILVAFSLSSCKKLHGKVYPLKSNCKDFKTVIEQGVLIDNELIYYTEVDEENCTFLVRFDGELNQIAFVDSLLIQNGFLYEEEIAEDSVSSDSIVIVNKIPEEMQVVEQSVFSEEEVVEEEVVIKEEVTVEEDSVSIELEVDSLENTN